MEGPFRGGGGKRVRGKKGEEGGRKIFKGVLKTKRAPKITPKDGGITCKNGTNLFKISKF